MVKLKIKAEELSKAVRGRTGDYRAQKEIYNMDK